MGETHDSTVCAAILGAARTERERFRNERDEARAEAQQLQQALDWWRSMVTSASISVWPVPCCHRWDAAFWEGDGTCDHTPDWEASGGSLAEALNKLRVRVEQGQAAQATWEEERDG